MNLKHKTLSGLQALAATALLSLGYLFTPPNQNRSPHNLRLNFSYGSSHCHRPPDQAASSAARYRARVP
jgi:hypothetical protein